MKIKKKTRILVKYKHRHDAQNKAFKVHDKPYKTKNTITMAYTMQSPVPVAVRSKT